MKKLFLLIAVMLPLLATAQEKDPALVAEYQENIFRTAVNMDPYEYIPGPKTAAPKGYKPFYISHYGRHGARSNWEGGYAGIMNLYDKAHDAGILTADGEAAREQIAEIIRLHDHMDGRLTYLGQQEHRQIAARMYNNYKEVFKNGSKKLTAISSIVPRCIISMNAATGQLLSMQPDLDIHWDTGETLQKYISSDHTREMRNEIKKILAKYYAAHTPDTKAFCAKVFTDAAKAKEVVGDIVPFMMGTYNMATGCPAFGLDDRLFRLFTDDDLYWYAQGISQNFYLGQCNSVEFGDVRMPRAEPLVDDIVARADAAIATGEYCADLRYGHDYQVLALGSLLGLEGIAERLDQNTCVNWAGWKYTPFAANIQLIFYRNKEGDVLVYPMLNERETKIIGLRGGPYYKWDDFKTYVGHGPKTTVTWHEGTPIDKRNSLYTMEISNPPAGTDWFIWFSQFRTSIKMQEGSQGKIEHVSGTLYRIVPTVDTKGQTLKMQYVTKPIVNQCRAPEAFYLVREGFPTVKIDNESVYLPAQPKHSFTYNPVELSVTDMIPRVKSVEYEKDQKKKPAGSSFIPADFAAVEYIPSDKPGWYRISIKDDMATLEAADADAAYWAKQTLDNIRVSAKGEKVRNMTVEDWPDLQYRGLMLDISRNFTKKEDLLKLIDIMSRYKANVLHLHMGDDEGWRVEIDALPELTSYGAFRGLPVMNADGTISEPDALQPTYSASFDRNDKGGSANGYYSHKDFVEILKYAAEHHIRVIPEFDTPGHSRAAIKAMEKRAELTGDKSCLLSEPGDTSKYVSVQDYTDNAINVALESTYKFVETVFDGLIAMYKEAGVPLEVIHVGGDEVPEGAWIGSPACQALMKKNGWKKTDRLKDYYVSRVLDIAASRGVKVAGWQELVQHLQPATKEKMLKGLGFTNVWTVSHGREELPYQFANAGLPVVISSAPNAYFDLAYNDSKLERGHSWAGFVDERRSFSLLPYSMYRSVRWDDHGKMLDISKGPNGKTPLEARQNIIGVQGQLWSETLRNFDHVTYYLFPKALGLLERGWNVSPVWEGTTASDDPVFMADFDQFYSIIKEKELPYYQSIGISYHTN